MPADRLSSSAEQMAACVEAVLAGTAAETAAAEAGVDASDVTDAMETYRAAGLAALQRRNERTWYQARVELPDWTKAECTFATQVAPRLDQLVDGHPAWWFLRKYPHWRLRIRTADRSAIEALLDELVVAGSLVCWWPGIYEPEAAAFGGLYAMNVVHDLFCTDSRGLLAHARQGTSPLGRRELSLLFIRALLQHAGLDRFEAGDVFDRVAQMRPLPPDAAASRVDDLASRMGPLMAITVRADCPLFAPGGQVADTASWLAGFIDAGQKIGEAAATGQLSRGPRAVLAHIVIFHWNRLGLSAEAQGILAHAAKAAVLPRS